MPTKKFCAASTVAELFFLHCDHPGGFLCRNCHLNFFYAAAHTGAATHWQQVLWPGGGNLTFAIASTPFFQSAAAPHDGPLKDPQPQWRAQRQGEGTRRWRQVWGGGRLNSLCISCGGVQGFPQIRAMNDYEPE